MNMDVCQFEWTGGNMDHRLEQRLKHCPSLPSPPAIASRLLELCEEPDLDMDDVGNLLRNDPALTARLLRAANSPIYGYRRRATTLKDALLFLGINGAVSLALTFTLSLPLRDDENSSTHYTQLWQRSALSALIATELAQHLGWRELEQLFLAALLQDIGIFALLRLEPHTYGELLAGTREHNVLPALEEARFGAAHPEIGAWLLTQWHVPKQITDIVASSHKPPSPGEPATLDRSCIAVSWQIAEHFTIRDSDENGREQMMNAVSALLGNRVSLITNVLDSVQERIPELNKLFEFDVIDVGMRESMLDRARELLLVRNLKIINQTENLKTRSRQLEARAQALQLQTSLDSLTGLHSRAALERRLEKQFVSALDSQKPLTLLMIDLDHLKQLNDQYGHITGDDALRAVGRTIRQCIRETDFAARYGGDEFVVLLMNTHADTAQMVAERIRLLLTKNALDNPSGQKLHISASIGIAALDPAAPYESIWQFVHAADQALYTAKHTGRNNVSLMAG